MSEYQSGAAQVARAHLTRKKVPLPESPLDVQKYDFGKLPELTGEELTALLGRIAQWQDYLETESALADINAESMEAAFKNTYDETLLRYGSSDRHVGQSVTELKAHANIDGAVIEMQRKKLEQAAIFKLIHSRCKGLEKLYAAASRELTRRGISQERNPDRDPGNWPNRRKIGG